MYRHGHIGVWLFLYAPIAYEFAVLSRPLLAIIGAALVFVIEPLPDRDQRIPFLAHRGFSHTFACALLVGAVLGVLAWVAGDQLFQRLGEWFTANGMAEFAVQAQSLGTMLDGVFLGVFGFAIGTFAILAHLAADVITPMGIRPFWPLSDQSYSLSLTPAADPIANTALLFLGGFVAAGVALLAFQGGLLA